MFGRSENFEPKVTFSYRKNLSILDTNITEFEHPFIIFNIYKG